MHEPVTTDEAVLIANSFDHAKPSAASLESSPIMDTVSEAAKKSPTRAPPPTKSSRLSRPTRVCSEPSIGNKPKAGNVKKASTRTLPTVERVGSDPRDDS